jgi:serine/arginine repetitive matrix protein 1
LQAEVDRIANEIQKKKEKEEESRELERERSKKMVMLTYSCWS